MTFDLGLGGLASFTGKQFAFGGLFLGVLGDERIPWIGLLSLTAVGNHSMSLQSGSAVWSRFALNAGPGVRFHFGSWAVEPFLEASIAWLHLRGQGFDPSTTKNGYDLGLGGGARGSLSLGKLRPWAAATVEDWLSGAKVAVEGGSPQNLPNVELLLEVGVSYELF
jgi:hypothetical protein